MQGKVFLCDNPAAGWWHAELGSELLPTDKTDLQHSFVWDTKRRDHLQMLLWRPISAYKTVWSGCLQHPPRPFTTAFCRITWVSVEFISVCEQSARIPVLAYLLHCCTLNHKAISWTHSCKLGDKCSFALMGQILHCQHDKGYPEAVAVLVPGTVVVHQRPLRQRSTEVGSIAPRLLRSWRNPSGYGWAGTLCSHMT